MDPSLVASPEPLALEPRLRLMRDGIINNLGFFISSAMGIVLVPILLTGLGPELYGLWIAALAAVNIAGLFEPGLGWAVIREVAATRWQENREETIRFVSAAGTAFVAIGLLGGVALGLLGLSVATELHLAPETQHFAPAVFALAGLAFFVNQVSGFTMLVLMGLRRFDVVNTVAVIEAFLRVSGVFLLLHSGFGFLPVVGWWVLATATSAVVGQVFISRLDPPLRFRPARLEWQSLRQHLPYGLSSRLALIGYSISWQGMPLLISLVLGSAAIVPYYIGQKFPVAIVKISGRASDVFFPAASEAASAGDQIPRTREILALGLRWTILLTLPLCLVLWVIAPNLLRVWMGEAQAEPLQILYLLTGTVLTSAVGDVAFHVLWARQAVRRVLGVACFTALATLGLSLLLLPRIGAVGAAWGVLLPLTAASFAYLAFATRDCGVHIFGLLWNAVRGLLLPGTACAAAAFLAMLLIGAASWPGVIGGAVAGGTAYVLTLYRTGAQQEERALVRELLDFAASAYKGLRRRLRGIPTIRSAYYFLRALEESAQDNSAKSRRELNSQFERQVDPWGYASTPNEGRRHQDELKMLDAVRAGAKFGKVLEIGCAEGIFTEMLAERCDSLLAVDISPVALERARERRKWGEQVRFQELDVRADPLPGPFDLIVIVHVLEYIRNRNALSRIREKVIASLRNGGYLLLGHVSNNDFIEAASWSKNLIRGGRNITAFMGGHPALQVVESREIELVNCRSIETLCQKSPAPSAGSPTGGKSLRFERPARDPAA